MMIDIPKIFKDAVTSVVFKPNLIKSLDVLCKTVGFGGLGDNPMSVTTFKALQGNLQSKMLLDGKSSNTWSDFADLLNSACSQTIAYNDGDDDNLAAIQVIASSLNAEMTYCPSLEKEAIKIGCNVLDARATLYLLMDSKSPFEFANRFFPNTDNKPKPKVLNF